MAGSRSALCEQSIDGRHPLVVSKAACPSPRWDAGQALIRRGEGAVSCMTAWTARRIGSAVQSVVVLLLKRPCMQDN